MNVIDYLAPLVTMFAFAIILGSTDASVLQKGLLGFLFLLFGLNLFATSYSLVTEKNKRDSS